MNLALSYYRYLQRKAFEAGRYGSLHDMRGQVLPWLGLAVGFGALGGWLFPVGSLQSNLMLAFAVFVWFGGIAIVCSAFIGVGIKRKKLEQDNG